MDLVLKILGH